LRSGVLPQAPAPKEKKAKNPLDLLPKSSMVLDEWKRQYSNLDTVGEGSACEWLWKNFDAEGYKWYWCKGKYAKEQTKAWQAANLLGGFLQVRSHARTQDEGRQAWVMVLVCVLPVPSQPASRGRD
jgi:hypothetical protein